MKQSTKILLALVAVTILAILCCCCGSGLYVYKNREAMDRGIHRIEADVRAFAEGHEKDDCLDEALRRARREWGLPSEMKAQMFLMMCLGATQPDPTFCDGVPRSDQILQVATWPMRECTRHHARADDQSCVRIARGIVNYCESGPFLSPSPPAESPDAGLDAEVDAGP